MRDITEFTVQAVINGRLVEDRFNASTAKQAWYKLGKKYGFNNYDFKVIGQKPIRQQIKFNV